jgi:CheY-like chemotaxis protein
MRESIISPEAFKRVLVVDDDDGIRHLLSSVLRQRALTVDEARDGQEAVDLIRENHYTVILLDLLMPVSSGFDVLDALARIDTAASAPVVLVLTGADRRVIAQIDSRHVHGVIRKPFDAEDIATLVLACSEVKERNTFGTMALATMMSGAPLLALLKL